MLLFEGKLLMLHVRPWYYLFYMDIKKVAYEIAKEYEHMFITETEHRFYVASTDCPKKYCYYKPVIYNFNTAKSLK